MTVEAWLRALAGKEARSIAWTGGDCVLVNDANPGIDASQWPLLCTGAGHPGASEAGKMSRSSRSSWRSPRTAAPVRPMPFAASWRRDDDGPDPFGSMQGDFESQWDERFPPTPE